ncbi:MAG: DNA repair protein RadC [Planctomycetes bacterium]|nr:DNA repair protein RadC [Planctomycetota bacterium]MCB9904820.1 DNA repair protein RadC [Planctomycetota bacterium]
MREVEDRGKSKEDAASEGLPQLARVLGLRGGKGLAELAALLEREGWVGLSRRPSADLACETGWSPERCERLSAVFDVGRRVESARWQPSEALRDPAAVHRLMLPRLRGLEREEFHVLLLDGKHRLRRVSRVSEGTLTSSLVHPREVFRDAVRAAAAAVLVVHNHPSGDPEPSREDLEVTERLVRAGRLLGIPLLDHLVVAEGGYVSLRERGWIRPGGGPASQV